MGKIRKGVEMGIQPIDITQIIVAIITFAGTLISAWKIYRPPPPQPTMVNKLKIIMCICLILLAANFGVFLYRCLITPSPPPSTPYPNNYIRECEYPDDYTVGTMIHRSTAFEEKVHGQFGCEDTSPADAKSGYVKYNIDPLYGTDHLYIVVRYSKNSPSTTAINIYIDDETKPRTSFIPHNQGDWNSFIETIQIDLGEITKGIHTISFSTGGQQYGVADLDRFTLLS
jgi:hypothetical protein